MVICLYYLLLIRRKGHGYFKDLLVFQRADSVLLLQNLKVIWVDLSGLRHQIHKWIPPWSSL